MFHRHDRKSKSAQSRPLKDLTAIVDPAQMLLDAKRKDLLDKINTLSALEASRFDSCCLNLIHNLINHCQYLPETSNSYYSSPGGLLDYALNRTEAALSLFREYIVLETNTDLSEEQKLWCYALCSAGLLQGLGKLQTDYHVDLFDANGQPLKAWHPLIETMTSVGHYYYFEFLKEGDDDFRRRLNILVAKLLMPASGYAWIISNPQVLAIWLALLSEDAGSAGTLGAILIRADAIAIQRYFNEFVIRSASGRGGRHNRITTFVDSTSETLEEKEFLLGIEFIKWLTNKLASGQIIINKSPLLSVPGGLLMSVEAFRMFIVEHPEYTNVQAVQNAFFSLNLHRLGTDGSPISHFEQTNAEPMQTGILINNYAVVLPEKMQIQHLHTGEISSLSATELIHQNQFNQQKNSLNNAMAYLSAAGVWQLTTEIKDNLQRNTRGV